jgi:hypothetical protein
VSQAIEFIETEIFTKQIDGIATDDDLLELQKELIAQPEKGRLIRETGGLRKVRMAVGGQGKSGAIRVIYYLAKLDRVYLILAYSKSEKDNLTDTEKIN